MRGRGLKSNLEKKRNEFGHSFCIVQRDPGVLRSLIESLFKWHIKIIDWNMNMNSGDEKKTLNEIP